MKKLVSMLLAVSMCVCVCISLTACGGSSAKFDFELSNDGSYYIITGINITEKTEVLDIPAEHDGKPVKAIMNWKTVKNNHSSHLKEINIPNSIRFIKWLSVDEGCVVNFGDYTNNLVSTSTFDFPKKGNDGSLDFNNLTQHTFYDFSLIIGGIVTSHNEGTFTFPENVVLAGNSQNTLIDFESIAFSGKLSTYQEGDGSNGWDDVVTYFPLYFSRAKTVEIPELAIGKGYSQISIHLPNGSGSNYATENVILCDLPQQVVFFAGDGNGKKKLNVFVNVSGATDDELMGINANFNSNPGTDFPSHLVKFYRYSETQPTDNNLSYWHYVDGVPTPW